MKREIPLRTKYRFVLTFGRIDKKENRFVFTSDPLKNSPVLSMENKSKWTLIENVYLLIKELK
jgi:hypothetical protein